jgi:release factor glutamine methyltransferase
MNSFNFKQTLYWFCKELSEYYEINELQSLFFIMMDDGFGYSKTYILTHYDSIVPENEFQRITEIVSRLQNNEPIQYILEKTTFCDLPFMVKSGVLIPRPETEELVQIILHENKEKEELHILDIGTGSGCIPISLAKFLPNAKVTSIDISEQCLEIACYNAQQNKVLVDFILANILEENVQFQNLDIIVSNPPYVLDSEKALMKPNVLEHEPHLALFVPDNDPLLFYRVIIEKAMKCLKPQGKLYFEINEQFAKEIEACALANGFSSAHCFKDIFGKDRILKIEK